jgi:Ca2+-binding RTX toxin-like protein
MMALILGTAGNDSLIGTFDADIIYGYAGNDTLSGQAGDDQLFGGDGNDSINESDGNDWIDGGNGADTLKGQDGNDTIYGGTDTGADFIDAGAGDDVIFGHRGADLIYGGAGTDFVGYAYLLDTDVAQGVYVDLSLLFAVDNFGDVDLLSGIEVVEGTSSAYGVASLDRFVGDGVLSDILIGDAGPNRFFANGGLDYVLAGGGSDTVYGGAGHDIVLGGGATDSLFGEAGGRRLADRCVLVGREHGCRCRLRGRRQRCDRGGRLVSHHQHAPGLWRGGQRRRLWRRRG